MDAELGQNRRRFLGEEPRPLLELRQVLLLSVQRVAIFHNLLSLNFQKVPNETHTVRRFSPRRQKKELPKTVQVNPAADEGEAK